MNKCLKTITAVAAIATLALALPLSAPAQGPLRSGSILAVSADTSDVTWVYPWQGCGGSLECWGWLETCNPDLAGRDVAVMSSIEPVADLAEALFPRKLRYGSHAGLRG